MADIAPGPIGCCYEDSHCTCLPPPESDCCTENVNNNGGHNVSCGRIDYTDYPNGWNYPPHTLIIFGHSFSPLEYQNYVRSQLRQVIGEADPSTDSDHDSEVVLLSSNRPIITIGGPPVLPALAHIIPHTHGELIHSIGNMEDLLYDSKGISFSEESSECASEKDTDCDYVSMHYFNTRALFVTLPPSLDVNE